ncbi:MAG: histidine phosphatase family protein [Rhodoferax sp.]|nr:histidine phosphatase family protein [Rhodoferax sp.]
MGNLYLVRHGQASFGADDYDMLSELGVRQSVRLGQYFAVRKLKFDAVIIGGLRRHAQTWAGIAQGGGIQADALVWPGLNEYDSEAVIRAIHPFPLEKVQSPEDYRAHFRLLRDGLRQWMDGVISPVGMPTYPEFVRGVTSALDHVRSQCSGNVLIVSSGGPISTAIGHLLGTTPETTVELNFRIRNSSVTELAFTPKRHMLVTYNTLPHLDEPEYASWITYA